MKITKAFIEEFKNMLPPDNYKLISFDVTSLFTNVLLDYTVSIILKRIYDQRELETKISRKEMKDILLLCTKNVHFSYDNKLYSQKDGVAMGSPLGPLITGIFMLDLERNVMPKLATHMTKGPSIKDVCILGGRAVRQKWINADRGRGWLAKCAGPLGKEIIATIFVKFTQIIWQYV